MSNWVNSVFFDVKMPAQNVNSNMMNVGDELSQCDLFTFKS